MIIVTGRDPDPDINRDLENESPGWLVPTCWGIGQDYTVTNRDQLRLLFREKKCFQIDKKLQTSKESIGIIAFSEKSSMERYKNVAKVSKYLLGTIIHWITSG